MADITVIGLLTGIWVAGCLLVRHMWRVWRASTRTIAEQVAEQAAGREYLPKEWAIPTATVFDVIVDDADADDDGDDDEVPVDEDVVVTCSGCGQKNRTPATLAVGQWVRCASCKAALEPTAHAWPTHQEPTQIELPLTVAPLTQAELLEALFTESDDDARKALWAQMTDETKTRVWARQAAAHKERAEQAEQARVAAERKLQMHLAAETLAASIIAKRAAKAKAEDDRRRVPVGARAIELED